MNPRMTRILIPVILGILLIIPLSGCGTQNASVSTQSTAQAAKSAAQDNAPITAQEVKSIDIKTTQGKAKVDQNIDKSLKSLDDSLKELDNSIGKLQ